MIEVGMSGYIGCSACSVLGPRPRSARGPGEDRKGQIQDL